MHHHQIIATQFDLCAHKTGLTLDAKPILAYPFCAMPVTLFTKENAAELGRKGGLTTAQREKERKQQALADREALQNQPLEPDQAAMREKVLRQLEVCDEMLLDCCDSKEFARLTASKERLWNLIMPKAGVLRPRQPRASRTPALSVSEAEPVQTPQEPVAIPAKVEQKGNDSEAPKNQPLGDVAKQQ